MILSPGMFPFITSIAATFLFLFALFEQPQEQAATIRVNVDLASVSVRVTDKQGRDVTSLTVNDFSVFEDGQQQKISFFDTETEPIALSILLDSSSSMDSDDKLGAAQAMVEELIAHSRLEDEVSVMQFTDHVLKYKSITREQRLLALPSGITSESGGTALYDAVASALCHLHNSKILRQAIVVITDGADQHSRIKLEQLIRLVQTSRAQLFIIGFYRGANYTIYKQSEKIVMLVTGREIDNPLVVFDRLAKESGAEAFFPTTKKGLEQAVSDISTILRSQYTLSYYPRGSTKALRHIQVKLNRSGVKIRARQTVAVRDPASEEVRFESDTCYVSAKAHPYPYEARLKQNGVTFDYREDFSDPATGWPNRPGSRYIPNGYELFFKLPPHKDNQILVDAGPIGRGALAAYGPWWDEFRASIYLDAGWAKMRAPTETRALKSQDTLDESSAGMAFRLNDGGYYAFLLSTSSQAYKADDLSFKLVKMGFNRMPEVVIPWTRISAKQIQKGIAAGIKLTVECRGDQIVLFIDDQQIGRARDATYGSGYVGLVTVGSAHVIFRNLRVEGTP